MDKKYKIKISCNPRQLRRIMELTGIRLDEKSMPKFDEALMDSNSSYWECEYTEEYIDQFIEFYFNKKTPADKQEKKTDYSLFLLMGSLVMLFASVINLLIIYVCK